MTIDHNSISHKVIAGALTGLVLVAAPTFAVGQGVQKQQAANVQTEASDAHLQWPRMFTQANLDYTIYQPQVDSWDGNKLEVRAAVAVKPVGAAEPKYGVAWFTAKTVIDRQTDNVLLENIEVTKVTFPSDEANADTYLAAFRNNIGANALHISLASLQAGLSVAEAEKGAKSVTIRNDPPQILFSDKPALLVRIDGKPVLRNVAGTGLLRVINTTSLIVFDEKNGIYYLRAFKHWYAAKTLDSGATPGQWQRVATAPAGLNSVLKAAGSNASASDTPPADLAEAVSAGQDPLIYTSFAPTELIQTEGELELAPVPDTKLLYVKNTSSHILVDEADQSYYVLISGRWFKSSALTGSAWTYVPSDSLPADFAKIPESHPMGAVLASVSGTPQAKEAVIDNAIPQMAHVARDKAKAKITYDGAPKLRPIEGTKLQYVANAPLPVILATDGRYYSVENGVWFVAASASGPWAVASEVPAEIYGIPASSPLHYVTYVRVYGSSDNEVYVGYTPGYFGTITAPAGVVVYGTGYAYDPWIEDYWYPAPATYGFGSGFAWGAVTGFAFGAVASNAWYGGAWGWGGAWGGAWGWHGWGWGGNNVVVNNFNFNNANIYNRWQNNAVQTNFRNQFNNRTGNLNNQIANRVNNGAGRLAQQQGQLRNMTPQQRAGAAHNFAQQHPRTSNNLFAGRDGNVYRRGAGGWEQHNGAGWNRIQHQDIGNRLNADQFARFHGNDMGGMRGFNGGGFRGGGFAGGGFHGGGFGGGGFRGGGFGGGFHGGGFRR